jgi:ribosomal protein S18 acetylase RimI-like enzyme
MIRYRPLSEDDFDAVVALWRRTPGIGLSSADESDRISAFLRRNPSMCIAAEIDNEVIGTVIAGHDGRRGYLYHVAVAPEWRRRGIGSELVDRVLRRMTKDGVLKCHVMVYSDNADGREFWQKTGWTPRPEIAVYSTDLE